MSRIVIKYPPELDGELWIEAERVPTSSAFMAAHWQFTFKHVETGGDEWSTLVAAARAIIRQDMRRKRAKAPSTQRTLESDLLEDR